MISDEDKKKLRRLIDARTKRDDADAAAKQAEKDYREIEAEVHEALAEGGMDRLNNVDLGPGYGKISFHAKTTVYGRILKGKEDDAHAYFEDRAMVDEIYAPKPVKARISEIVRDLEEQDLPMPPGLDYYKKRYVQITRQKGS